MEYRLNEYEVHNNLTLTELLEAMDNNAKILKHFKCDLYADFHRIMCEDMNKNATQFWWVVRECGTWLHQISNTEKDKYFAQMMLENYNKYEVYLIVRNAHDDWTIKRQPNNAFEVID